MGNRAKQLVVGVIVCGAGLSGCDDAADGPVTDTVADAAGDATDTAPEVSTPVLAIVVNEVAPAGAPDDWIELFNAGETRAEIGGWVLRDDDPRHGYVVPAGTAIAAGGYLVIGRTAAGGDGFDFGLGSADGVFLFDAAGRLVDGTSWNDGAAPASASWGRIPDGSGSFVTLETPSRGARNVDNRAVECGDQVAALSERCDGSDFHGATCASFGWGGGTLACISECKLVSQAGCSERAPGLVLNEVESDGTDRVELYNGTDAEVDLAGFSLVDAGGNTFIVPNGRSIAAKSYLVLERDVDHLFGLGSVDGLTLFDAQGGRVDGIAWEDGEAVPSLCRAPDGTGGFHHCASETFGAANP